MPLARLMVPQPITVSMLPIAWGSWPKAAMPKSPNSTPDATDIGFDLACRVTQAQRGAAVFFLWLALATRSKYLGAGSPRLARRNVLIVFNFKREEATGAVHSRAVLS